MCSYLFYGPPKKRSCQITDVVCCINENGDSQGHATSQAASNRLFTAVARVRFQVMSYGTCGGQNDNEAGFPLPILISLTPPHLLIILLRTLH
jgi:hypothetical protein